jgi:hypothetical protein
LGDESDHSGISRFNVLRLGFENFTSSSVDLVLNFLEFASNMGGVAIEDGCVSVLDLSGMVKNDNLSLEVLSILGGVVL